MTIATDLQADMAALMADTGRAMTLKREVAGTYDPTTGETSSNVETLFTGNGRLGSYSDIVTNGTLIKQNDRRATFVPDDLTNVPQVGDILAVGSDSYSIINVKEREIAGQFHGFTMQVRR